MTEEDKAFVSVSHKINLGNYESAEISMGETTTILEGADPKEIRSALYVKLVEEVMVRAIEFQNVRRHIEKLVEDIEDTNFSTGFELLKNTPIANLKTPDPEPKHGEDAHKLNGDQKSTKDFDTVTDGQLKYIKDLATQGYADQVDEFLSKNKIKHPNDLSKKQASTLIDKLVKMNGKK